MVSHWKPLQKGTLVSAFGHVPAPVQMVDGVFMAVHVPSVMAVGWRFNEAFEFHHYDLAGSLDAGERGLRVGVVRVHLVHVSHGLDSRENLVWKPSEAIFQRLYRRYFHP